MDAFDTTLFLSAASSSLSSPSVLTSSQASPPTNGASLSEAEVGGASGLPLDEDSQANYGSYCDEHKWNMEYLDMRYPKTEPTRPHYHYHQYPPRLLERHARRPLLASLPHLLVSQSQVSAPVDVLPPIHSPAIRTLRFVFHPTTRYAFSLPITLFTTHYALLHVIISRLRLPLALRFFFLCLYGMV
ncbi:hypothetical protein C8R43DRAFT_1228868 [Mycena crocata]|nr:hypothetical protein C8R43DRAFT_1228868 [Mycena crocata]